LNDMSYNFSKNSAANKFVSDKTYEDEKWNWKILWIFARNCVEWVVTDLGCQMNDITTVTFYSTLGADSFEHIFKQTNISTICVSPENIQKLVDFYKKFKFDSLKNVIVFDMTLYMSKDKSEVNVIKEAWLNVFLFSDLIKKPNEDVVLSQAKPDSVLTLCYTSGTTNLPKWAMLSQRWFAVQKYVMEDSLLNMNENDVTISYLPLAHVMERLAIFVWLSKWVKIGFISWTDVKKCLMDDIVILKPTILIAVPRILVGFHQKVMDTFSKLTWCAKSMADSWLETKRENYKNNLDIKHWYYDSLVFKKVRAKFWWDLRVIITWSAPLPRDVSTDIKLLLSIPILEWFWMTELCWASNGTNVNDLSNYNVWWVIRTLRMKLVDKKEMNYHSLSTFEEKLAPTWEICFKWPSVFNWYFRD